MLANSMTATPRPVAPGRAKRMASVPRPAATRTAVSPRVKSSPPPPYAQRDIGRQRVDSLLGSPVAVTSQMVEYFRPSLHVESTHEASGPEDWMEEKSREELHDLLVRADQTIKEREDGMYNILRTLHILTMIYRTKLDLVCLQGPVPRQHPTEREASFSSISHSRIFNNSFSSRFS
jgi:hypothetical protein